MKKILIPTDFSDNARIAISYAFEFYKNIPCEFHILHTYDMSATQLLATVSSHRVGYMYELTKTQSEQELELTMQEITSSNLRAYHTFKAISRPGSLVEIIENLIKENYYDLILMATKGATGAKEVFIGSNTQKVIQNIAHCPILVVPDDCLFHKISNIAFATNFERMYYKSELNPIKDLAKIHQAMVKMIHVNDQPKLTGIQNYNSGMLEQRFQEIPYDFHVIEDFSNIEKAIQTCIEELEIDLLAMINYKRSFIKQLMREPVIKKMTFHTVIPFLVIPADN